MANMRFTKSQAGGKVGDDAISESAKLPIFVVAVVAGAIAAGACLAKTQSSTHTVTVTFDYDFTAMHACSPKVTKKCVARFVVYDISGMKPYKLFTIPAPADANGPIKGISGKSEPLLFESGKHLLAATAQKDSGEESRPQACSVWVAIP
jgi:hypothetical protein